MKTNQLVCVKTFVSKVNTSDEKRTYSIYPILGLYPNKEEDEFGEQTTSFKPIILDERHHPFVADRRAANGHVEYYKVLLKSELDDFIIRIESNDEEYVDDFGLVSMLKKRSKYLASGQYEIEGFSNPSIFDLKGNVPDFDAAGLEID